MREKSFFEFIKQGNLVEVKKLVLKNPKLLFCQDRAGNTPLHVVARYGIDKTHYELTQFLVEQLMEQDKDIGDVMRVENELGMTPLHHAETYGLFDEEGVLNNRNIHDFLIVLDCIGGNSYPRALGTLDLFRKAAIALVSGKKVNNGKAYVQTIHPTLLHFIISRREKGTDNQGWWHKSGLIETLVNYGIDLNAVDTGGRTPLVRILAQKSFTLSSDGNVSPKTIDENNFVTLLEYSLLGNEIVKGKEIPKSKTNLNIRDRYGKTAMHYVVENEFKNTAPLFLKYDGVDDVEDKRGYTPWQYWISVFDKIEKEEKKLFLKVFWFQCVMFVYFGRQEKVRRYVRGMLQKGLDVENLILHYKKWFIESRDEFEADNESAIIEFEVRNCILNVFYEEQKKRREMRTKKAIGWSIFFGVSIVLSPLILIVRHLWRRKMMQDPVIECRISLEKYIQYAKRKKEKKRNQSFVGKQCEMQTVILGDELRKLIGERCEGKSDRIILDQLINEEIELTDEMERQIRIVGTKESIGDLLEACREMLQEEVEQEPEELQRKTFSEIFNPFIEEGNLSGDLLKGVKQFVEEKGSHKFSDSSASAGDLALSILYRIEKTLHQRHTWQAIGSSIVVVLTVVLSPLLFPIWRWWTKKREQELVKEVTMTLEEYLEYEKKLRGEFLYCREENNKKRMVILGHAIRKLISEEYKEKSNRKIVNKLLYEEIEVTEEMKKQAVLVIGSEEAIDKFIKGEQDDFEEDPFSEFYEYPVSQLQRSGSQPDIRVETSFFGNTAKKRSFSVSNTRGSRPEGYPSYEEPFSDDFNSIIGGGQKPELSPRERKNALVDQEIKITGGGPIKIERSNSSDSIFYSVEKEEKVNRRRSISLSQGTTSKLLGVLTRSGSNLGKISPSTSPQTSPRGDNNKRERGNSVSLHQEVVSGFYPTLNPR